ncbi:barstar family protein [Nocardia stercoris]|uniref:Barnase inhibitor n=1 Tax=Nocardia stercoris TaxID=2483361 RepID=A0A3M2L1M7_9NOCA|nr:barstar family protein [Nocardia stercoris]RMI30630.1 barnase inhibitor [Nocardia stercoris]
MNVTRKPPVLVIDGDRFDDYEGFTREFSSLLDDHRWHGNLDAFSDILSGGFGTPEEGFTLRWDHSDRSRRVLGHRAQADLLRAALPHVHPDNARGFRARIAHAEHGRGPTLFDTITEIIREHRPGGPLPGNVVLTLV